MTKSSLYHLDMQGILDDSTIVMAANHAFLHSTNGLDNVRVI